MLRFKAPHWYGEDGNMQRQLATVLVPRLISQRGVNCQSLARFVLNFTRLFQTQVSNTVTEEFPQPVRILLHYAARTI